MGVTFVEITNPINFLQQYHSWQKLKKQKFLGSISKYVVEVTNKVICELKKLKTVEFSSQFLHKYDFKNLGIMQYSS